MAKRVSSRSTLLELREALASFNLDDHGKKETLIRWVGQRIRLHHLDVAKLMKRALQASHGRLQEGRSSQGREGIHDYLALEAASAGQVISLFRCESPESGVF